ncbi:hypothetical protein M9458_031171, partial [Cirrhinus mrigala]
DVRSIVGVLVCLSFGQCTIIPEFRATDRIYPIFHPQPTRYPGSASVPPAPETEARKETEATVDFQ